VRRTTGSRVLDAAAAGALRQWRFKPSGALLTRNDPKTTKFSKILVPVTFTM
jgi:outer membrane biosynthesis protein TonB